MRVLSIRQVMHTFHLLYYLMAFRQIYKGKMICREIRHLPKQLKKSIWGYKQDYGRLFYYLNADA